MLMVVVPRLATCDAHSLVHGDYQVTVLSMWWYKEIWHGIAL